MRVFWKALYIGSSAIAVRAELIANRSWIAAQDKAGAHDWCEVRQDEQVAASVKVLALRHGVDGAA